MKTIEYWEKQREEALERLRRIQVMAKSLMHESTPLTANGALNLSIPRLEKNPRNLRIRGRRWASFYRRWQRNQQFRLGLKKKHTKTLKQIAYIEERIRVLTPTFWAHL